MKIYQHYFSATKIIKLICKYRIKAAKESHKKHLLADISSSEHIIKDFKREKGQLKKLYSILPPRRSWYKPNKSERNRYNDPQKLQFIAIAKAIKTTHLRIIAKQTDEPEWYKNLQAFIKEIQYRARHTDINKIKKPRIFPIEKGKKGDVTECRPISIYDLEDRIIISLTAKYLTDIFDDVFLECSYAFRAVKKIDSRLSVKTHHDAVQKILDYFEKNSGKKIYAAECDLEKFFDCISHELAYDKLNSIAEEYGINVDANAKEIFAQYLQSYSFNKDVYIQNQEYFNQYRIQNGRFVWALESLKKEFYSSSNFGINLNKISIGVPQGGAISCFLANLFLHSADIAVSNIKDPDLLYLRFCDDMIILHTRKNGCENALENYLYAIKELKLIVHTPKDIKEYSKEFWSEKSKKPYEVGPRKASKFNVPWISFVGYQIKYDGSIRVRKKSLVKEKAKQVQECKNVLKALEYKNSNVNINSISKKSRQQQMFALENRLISMSVGRVRLHEKNCQRAMCWTNGFKLLIKNRAAQGQMKMLDRHRVYQLYKMKKALVGLINPSKNPDFVGSKRFFGHPYSYHGFLREKDIS